MGWEDMIYILENNLLFGKVTQKFLGKNQEVLAKGRNFLVEPGTSGLKSLVEPRSLKMDTLPVTRKMKILLT